MSVLFRRWLISSDYSLYTWRGRQQKTNKCTALFVSLTLSLSAIRRTFEINLVESPFRSHVDISKYARNDQERRIRCIAYGSLVQLVHF